MLYAFVTSNGGIKMEKFEKYIQSFLPKKQNQTPDVEAMKNAGIPIEEN